MHLYLQLDGRMEGRTEEALGRGSGCPAVLSFEYGLCSRLQAWSPRGRQFVIQIQIDLSGCVGPGLTVPGAAKLISGRASAVLVTALGRQLSFFPVSSGAL